MGGLGRGGAHQANPSLPCSARPFRETADAGKRQEIETDGHRDAAFKLVFSNTHPLTGNNGAETAQKEHYIVV